MSLSLLVAGFLFITGCASKPEPCACGQAEQELRYYTEQYHYCLEDVGNLRHQLKAYQEKH